MVTVLGKYKITSVLAALLIGGAVYASVALNIETSYVYDIYSISVTYK